MAYWSGDITAQMEQECEHLRERFRPSRAFLDRMEDLYDRSRAVRRHPIEALLPSRFLNPTDRAQMARTLFTSNHVKQMVHSYLDRMERSDIVVNVAMTARNAAEGAKQHLLEQLCQGLLSRQSRATVDQKRGTTFIRRMSAYAMRRGAVVQRINLARDEDGKARIEWELYDPYNTYYTTGGLPRKFFYDHYERKDSMTSLLLSMGLSLPRGEAWGKARDGDMVRMTDYWCEYEEDGAVRVDNVIAVAGWPVRVPDGHTGFDRMPIHVLAMNEGDLEPNASPLDGYGGSASGIPDRYTERIREPIYSSLEQVIPQLEDRLSLEQLAEMFRVAPPKKLRKVGVDAADSVEWEYELWGPDTTVVMPDGWDIEMMQMSAQTSPVSSLIVTQHLAQIDRVFPSVLWSASSGANESGWHLYQRLDQGKNAIVSPVLCVAFALQAGLEEVLHQFRRSGDAAMDLQTNDNPDFERYEIRTFRASDLPDGGYELNVTVPPELPTDPMAQAQLFTSVIQSGAMDERKALGKVMFDQDPEGTIRRKILDYTRNSQPVKDEAVVQYFLDTAEALEDEARRSKGEARWRILRAARRYKDRANALEQRLGLAFQMQPQAGNPAPAQQPPEARGAENPSFQRALAGIAPPGGRPPEGEPQDGGF